MRQFSNIIPFFIFILDSFILCNNNKKISRFQKHIQLERFGDFEETQKKPTNQPTKK